MTSPAPCRQRRLVVRHFRGHITPPQEGALRAHLPDCAACRRFYDRHLLYEKLTHARRPPVQRLAAGLDIEFPARPSPVERAARSPFLLAGMAAVAGFFLLFARPTRDTGSDDFVARGVVAPAAIASQVDIYRVSAGKPPALVTGHISARDELAFAYRNPHGFQYLLLFGVDERQTVYWFHPAWIDARKPPTAIRIDKTNVPRELGEGVRHDLRGRRLRVMGVFANQPLSVTTIEAQVQRGRFDLPGTERSETMLEVEP